MSMIGKTKSKTDKGATPTRGNRPKVKSGTTTSSATKSAPAPSLVPKSGDDGDVESETYGEVNLVDPVPYGGVFGRSGVATGDSDPDGEDNGGDSDPDGSDDSTPRGDVPSGSDSTEDRDDGRPPTRRNARSEAAQTLALKLTEINGQDAYDASTAALGKLSFNEYLVLPEGFPLPLVQASDVGKPTVHYVDPRNEYIYAQIYALNKARAPAGSDSVKYALTRMQACAMGWYNGQTEVRMVEPLDDPWTTYDADAVEIFSHIESSKTAAFLVPLAAEQIFRTTGHHFLSGQAALYTTKYSKILAACLQAALDGFLPPNVMYHHVLHWVGPARVREVLLAVDKAHPERIPEAIRTRIDAAPSGTALVCTTAAVLESMKSANLLEKFVAASGLDLQAVIDSSTAVKENVTGYHKAYFAYGVPKVSEEHMAALENAKVVAANFAPVAQAYITTMLADAALGRAAALQKHADNNPVQKRRAARYFKALARRDISDIAQIYATDLHKDEAEV